jgi:hypothetical protein
VRDLAKGANKAPRAGPGKSKGSSPNATTAPWQPLQRSLGNQGMQRLLRAGGQPLDPVTRASMESRLGHDFSMVRVHSGPAAAQSASDLNANAYTAGNQIVFGADRLAPTTYEGRRLLAHELTHIAQADTGAANPSLPSSSAESLEREAREVAHSVLNGGAVPEIHGVARGLTLRDDSPEPAPIPPNQPISTVKESTEGFDLNLAQRGWEFTGDLTKGIAEKRKQLDDLNKRRAEAADEGERAKLDKEIARVTGSLERMQNRLRLVSTPQLKDEKELNDQRQDLAKQLSGKLTKAKKETIEKKIAALDAQIAAVKLAKANPEQADLSAFEGTKLVRGYLATTPEGKKFWTTTAQHTFVTVQVTTADGRVFVFQERNVLGGDHAEDVVMKKIQNAGLAKDLAGAKMVIFGDQEVCDRCQKRVPEFAAKYGIHEIEGYTTHAPSLKTPGQTISPKDTALEVSDPAAVRKREAVQGKPTTVRRDPQVEPYQVQKKTFSWRKLDPKVEAARGAVTAEWGTETSTVKGGEKRTRTRSTKASARQGALASTGTYAGQGGVAVERMRRVETVTATGTTGTESSLAASVDPQGTASLTVKKTRDTGPAATPEGPKPNVGAQAGAHIGPTGYGGTVGALRQTASGTQHGVNIGLTQNWEGGTSAHISYQAQTAKGHGASVTVSGGHSVTAEDPVEVAPGVWEVRYTVTDSSTVGAGGSVKGPGLLGGGASGSVTEADLKTASRRFTDEKAAQKFKENAADRVAKEGGFGYFPPTTVAGALSIPIGEARGIGTSRTKAGSVSATFGATLSKSGHTTSSGELTVRRVGLVTVQVTTMISGTEGSDWGISAVLENEAGGSTTNSYAITYEFNLATNEGVDAFERFVKFPLPPGSGAKRVSVETLKSSEGHDRYTLFGGTRVLSGTTFEARTTDEQGTHERYGGVQADDQKPGWILSLLGDEELHSKAQIVRAQENDKDVGAKAEFKVSGESGEHNRAEFGKIFLGARHSGTAKASGDWTLTAPVPQEAIRELEKSSPRLRAARTMDDKMRVYSELVKEHGAPMLGGQVGITSKGWDLQLKGDDNFPGEKGRQRLNQLRKDLADALKASPDSADAIVRQAGEEIGRLQKRRSAVADPKRYTDLPEGLREEQLALIDQHIDKFRRVRRNAQAVAMKRTRGETDVDAADRLRKDRYDLEFKASDRAYAKLQDKVHVTEAQISTLSRGIHDSSRALGDVLGAKGSIALRLGVDSATAQAAQAEGMDYLHLAIDADKAQAALDPEIEQLREAWTAAQDPKARLETIRGLEKVLAKRFELMRLTIDYIRRAGKAVYPVAGPNAISVHPDFWESLGGR